MVQLTRKLFQEIAIRVDAQDSEHVLHVRAVAIANKVSDAVVGCASVRRDVSHDHEEQPQSESEDVLSLIYVEFDILDDTEHVNVEVELFSREFEGVEHAINPERSRDTVVQGDIVFADNFARVVEQPWQSRWMPTEDVVFLCCHEPRRTALNLWSPFRVWGVTLVLRLHLTPPTLTVHSSLGEPEM